MIRGCTDLDWLVSYLRGSAVAAWVPSTLNSGLLSSKSFIETTRQPSLVIRGQGQSKQKLEFRFRTQCQCSACGVVAQVVEHRVQGLGFKAWFFSISVIEALVSNGLKRRGQDIHLRVKVCILATSKMFTRLSFKVV